MTDPLRLIDTYRERSIETKVICLYFSRVPTIDEMRAIHGVVGDMFLTVAVSEMYDAANEAAKDMPFVGDEGTQPPLSSAEEAWLARQAREADLAAAPPTSGMSDAERALLLTVARILRAHLRESIPITQDQRDDIAALNDALLPWEAAPAVVPINPNGASG